MAQIHWANAISGDFQNFNNWSGGFPNAGDDAFLDAAGANFTATVSRNQDVGSIQTTQNAVLDITGGIFTTDINPSANAGVIIVGDNATFSPRGIGGTMANTGAIEFLAGGKCFLQTTFYLTGGGVVSLSAGSGIVGYYGRSVFNVDNTISGAGTITSELVNELGGLINETGSGVSMTINCVTAINQGMIEATGAAGLDLGRHLGRITNFGGTIFAGSGSHVFIKGEIDGGTLASAGTGVIGTSDAALNGGKPGQSLANEGRIEVVSGGTLGIAGAIVNSGTIGLDSAIGDAPTQLTVDAAGASLTGAGTVSLGGAFSNIVRGGLLTNVANTIVGGGAITAAVTNEVQGVIDANGTVALRLKGNVTNAGLIEATGAGVLVITNAAVYGAGGGVIDAAGGKVQLNGADIVGGALRSSGNGAIQVTNGVNVLDGTTSAVNDLGRVVIAGGRTLTIEGTITGSGVIAVNSSTSAAHLLIAASGATLSGATISLNNRSLNLIQGVTAASVLTNNGKITGAGNLGGGQLTLVNGVSGKINGNAAFGLTIDTGTNTITNAGTIGSGGTGGTVVMSAMNNTGLLFAAKGNLTVNGAVSGAGTASVNAATLAFGSSFDENVTFTSGTGVLRLAQSQSYGGTISGFSKTGASSLDLRDITFGATTKAGYSGTTASGVLTVTGGTHTANIHFTGNYTKSAFTVSSDGHGGTTVTAPAAGATTAPFIAASAGFSPRPMAAATPRHWDHSPRFAALVGPRLAFR